MQNRLSSLGMLLVWLVYLATDIYGHTAFKIAGRQDDDFNILRAIFSFWGITAGLAWVASSVLWITILAHTELFIASSIGAITYALMVAVALLVFRETISTRQIVGIVLILAGIYFVAR
jgi:drug/metabolite transporter (DMT)-like permease